MDIPILRPAAALAGALAVLSAGPAHAGHDMAMSDAAMEAMAGRYWATHARVGTNARTPLATTAAVETVTVAGFQFDADGNAGTQVDTVRIAPGDAVYWEWIGGTHTVTSGTGSLDPASGALFNQPLNSTATAFQFTFNDPGTVPYYCAIHEGFNMKGVVIVDPLVGVDRTPVGTGIGFASHPWPNPTGAGVHFRYTLRAAGRVRAEVHDVRGRLVAVVLDGAQAAGTYEASWDGRTRAGARATAGTYFLHLALPGYAGTQTVIMSR